MNDGSGIFLLGVIIGVALIVVNAAIWMPSQLDNYIEVASGKVVCELQETDTKTMEWNCVENP